MTKEPIFNWDKETKTATCTIVDGLKTYTGIAKCHPEDEDMMNEKTGFYIAGIRANIALYQGIRDEYKQQLIALEHLLSLYEIKNIHHGYEYDILVKQINNTKNQIDTYKTLINLDRKTLVKYLNDKESFYKAIRKNRQKINRAE